MNFNFLRSFLVYFSIISFILISGLSAQAQKKGSPSAMPARASSSVNYRILANYDYIMTNPSDLNNFGAGFTWGGTTKAQGSFGNMNGYTLGASYLAGSGFLGFEYSYGVQELTKTTVIPTSDTIQYTFDYQTMYALYDWVFNRGSNQSFELGGGIGYALKYQYHMIKASGSTIEELIWQANPITFKIRAHYNYHFSNNFRLRVGATYEYATSSSLRADSSHPGITINGVGIVSGQNMAVNGQDVKVDISGLRLNAGVVVAF